LDQSILEGLHKDGVQPSALLLKEASGFGSCQKTTPGLYKTPILRLAGQVQRPDALQLLLKPSPFGFHCLVSGLQLLHLPTGLVVLTLSLVAGGFCLAKTFDAALDLLFLLLQELLRDGQGFLGALKLIPKLAKLLACFSPTPDSQR
jgi:hypothetical protein